MGKKTKRRNAQTKVHATALTAEVDAHPLQIDSPFELNFSSWWQSKLELHLVLPESGHAVSNFIESVLVSDDQKLRDLFEVFNDDMFRELAIDILVRIGTFACNDCNNGNAMGAAKNIAFHILTLESYNGEGDDLIAAMFRSGMGLTVSDLKNGGEREVIRFFTKRIKCSCLKARYKQIKVSHPKSISRCENSSK